MNPYGIQFSVDDVVARVPVVKSDMVGNAIVQHSLKTGLWALVRAPFFAPNATGELAECISIAEKYGCKTRESISGLFASTNPEKLAAHAQDYIANLSGIAEFLPIAGKFSPSMLTDDAAQGCNRIDAYGVILFYNTNKVFSKAREPEFYVLNTDYSFFSISAERALLPFGICFPVPSLPLLYSPVDYVANAIAPLVWNAGDAIAGAATPVIKPSVAVSAEVGTSYILIRVKDNGPGVAPENQLRIFERGFSTKPKGCLDHGDGLWGVKQFVEANGGRITFSSKPGDTCFEFTIPVAEICTFHYRHAPK